MDTFLARCDKATGEVLGIVIISHEWDVWNLPSADPDSTYNVLTNHQFHHLQGSPGFQDHCTRQDPSCHLGHHRYEGCKLVAKARVELACDTHNITIRKDKAQLTWYCPTPLKLRINASVLGPYTGQATLVASQPGIYTIQVEDSHYYSDVVTVNAEEELDG